MKCLVVGGGVGGLAAIKGLRKLDKDVEIVLVEPKAYFEIAWATYRCPFDESTAEQAIKDLKDFCAANKVQHIQEVVTKLSGSQAVLKSGTTIDFDVCVVATGAGYCWEACGRGPPDEDKQLRQARLDFLKSEGEKLLNAESVLIVGGGLIGTEVAGDVAFYKKKLGKPVNVTLVQSGSQLCTEMKPKAAHMVKCKLEKLGVKVVLNDRVDVNAGSDTATLQSTGEAIQAEQVVKTVGNRPLNQFMDASLLNEQGWVTVDECFRVKGGNGTIFALGDCCDLLPNSASQLLLNIGVMGKNLSLTLKALKNKRSLDGLQLKKHVHGTEIYVGTVGAKDGVVSTSMFSTQWFLPSLKNKTMFFFRIKSELGI